MAVLIAGALCVAGVLVVRVLGLARRSSRPNEVGNRPPRVASVRGARPGAARLGALITMLAGAVATGPGPRVPAHARTPGVTVPPLVTVSPISGTHFTSSSAAIQVDVCSATPVSATLTMNGGDVTSSFSAFQNAAALGCPQYGTTWTGSPGLISGANTFVARVCDTFSTCRAVTMTYVFDPPVPTRISLSPSSPTLQTKATTSMHATVFDQSGNAMTVASMTWASSNPAVVSLQQIGSQDATLTGQGAGTAIITASIGALSATAAVTVTAPTPVARSLSLTPPSANFLTGTMGPMHATVYDQTGQTMAVAAMNWTTSNSAVASLLGQLGNPQDVTITAASAGSATVTASTGTASATAAITVTTPIPSPPTVDPPSPVSIAPGTSGVMRFRVWSGAQSQAASLTATCGGLVNCAVTPTVFIGAFSVVLVDVSVAATASQLGAFPVTLTATGPGGAGSASGTVTVQVVGSLALVATPPTSSAPVGSAGMATYRLTNNTTGPISATTAIAGCTGAIGTCLVDPWTPPGAGGAVTIVVRYRALAATAGQPLTLLVTAGSLTVQAAVSVVVTPLAPVSAIAVTPSPSASSTTLGAPGSASYLVANTSTSSTTPLLISFSVSGCATAITPCSTPAPVTLAQGASQSVPVGYTGAAVTSLAAVALTLTASTPSASSSQGTVSVTVTPATPPQATVITVVPVGPFPGGTIPRDACLTISAGAGAAYECGSLRLIHQLPSTRTFSTTRTPTLLFASDHAAPGTILAADVSVRGTTIPASVDVTVKLGGKSVTKSFPWNAAMSTGQWWRIGIPIDADALTLTNGSNAVVLADTIEVKATANGSALATDTKYGTVALVDRRNSPFGAGWWLDGLEQFVSVDATHKLWVGGDGSTRIYTQQGTSSVWLVTPALARPESLTYSQSTGRWHRLLSNGAYVEFDNAGVHQQTRDALGHVTTFTYTVVGATQVVASILLPVQSGTPPPIYTFAYTAAGSLAHLKSVTSPYLGGRTRADTFFRARGWVTRIKDADGTHVDFLYDGVNTSSVRHAIARVNRLGDSTFFSYDAAGLLHSAKLDMRRTGGSGAPFVTHTYCPSESRSVAACSVQNPSADFLPQPRASVYTLYDGPRAGNADTTHLELTSYGAPSRIVSALGGVTTITRADARWPLLVTEVTDARGHTERATYDARAHVATTTDVNPDSAGAANHDATTTYQWDASWDHVTSVVSPTGISRTTTYDPATGDRLTEWTGGVLRASYGYSAPHMLRTITTPLSTTPTRLDYDALGNVWRTVTPTGITSLSYRDGIGRDSVVQTPVDTAAGRWRYGVVTHDIMDRVIAQVDSAGATSATDFQATRVETQYDAEGQMVSLIRTAIPDAAALGSIETRYTYDEAGNRLTETDPYLAAGSQTARWVYDPAGNVVRHFDKQAIRNVSMQYDVMNRLASRTLTPTGTRYSTVAVKDTFEYDVVGNLRSARNQFAEVGRTYTLAGRLALDTLRIKAANLATAGMSHVYAMVNGYDLEGRRTWQRQPANQTPSVGSLLRYAYDPLMGALSDVQDLAGNHFLTYYNDVGLPRAFTMSGGIAEVLTYDDDGRLYHRVEQGIQKTIHDESRVLDVRGKITSVSDVGDVQPVNGSFTFTGLGAALLVQTNGAAQETQRVTVDALGDVLRETRQIILDGGKRYAHAFAYQPHSTRIQSSTGTFYSFDEGSSSPVSGTDTLSHVYDADGHLSHSSYVEGSPGSFGGHTIKQASWYSDFIYNALGQLMGADHHTVNDNEDWNSTQYRPSGTALATGHGAYEEYRYDPLGRRIWTRSHRDTYCTPQQQVATSDCLGFVTRTVWDGDQVLYELRAPGNDAVSATDLERDDGGSSTAAYPLPLLGQVMYVHGAGIDQPLELVRSGWQYHLLHLSQRGLVDMTTNPAGDYSTCGFSPLGVACADVTWPGVDANYYYAHATTYQYGPRAWYGDMVRNFQDASGLQYRRNRYFDPTTGRFTQEDPIGIAGGVNLYGFGGGDLVNYADPFGLCPEIPSLCVGAVVAAGKAIGRAAATPTGQRVIQRGSQLARNLAQSGAVRQAGEAAHHIVARAAAAAEPAREVLAEYGVQIDEAVNGVFLPAVRNYSGQAVNHLTLHTAEYYRTANRALQNVQSKEEVVQALTNIRDRLRSGGTP